MQRQIAPFKVPALSANERRVAEWRRSTMARQMEHKVSTPQDTSPDAHWQEVIRVMELPVQKRPAPVGAYGLPMFYCEVAHMGIKYPEEEQPLDYAAFSRAHQLHNDHTEKTEKWVMEAMLCMGMSQLEIHLETGIQEDVVKMYDYYFFNMRSKTETQILHYIKYSTTSAMYDGMAKYFGALWGFKWYQHFRNSFVKVDTKEDSKKLVEIIRKHTIGTLVGAAVNPNAPLEQQMGIHMMGMKDRVVTHKIDTDNSRISAGGVGAPGASEGDYFQDYSDEMVLGMTKIEDQRALEEGGRAAADYIEDAKKTHMQSAMEVLTAPVDIMTEEDLKTTGFQQDSGDI